MKISKKLFLSLISIEIITMPNISYALDAEDLEVLKAEIRELKEQMRQIKSASKNNQNPVEKIPPDNKSLPIVKAQDGFGFKSADGKNEINLTGRIQADYHYFGKNDAQNADTPNLRRTYLTVQGKIYNDYEFKVSADFAQQSNLNSPSGVSSSTRSALDEAYFGINWWKQAKFRFGLFNMPFGLENYTSDLFNDFSERSLTEALSSSKERGAMVHGNPLDGLYYGLAVSSGRGKNVDNTDPNADSLEIIGRGTANFAQLFNKKNIVVHLGGGFSHGYISGNSPSNFQNASANTTDGFLVGQGHANSKTEGNGLTFFLPTPLYLTAGSEVERTRMGAEFAAAYGPIKLQSEYITHNYQGIGGIPETVSGVTSINRTTPFDSNIDAWYTSLNWLVTGESYSDNYTSEGTWGRIKPKQNFTINGAGWGALVLGARYSNYDASDFSRGKVGGVNALTGAYSAYNMPTGAHAYTLAATWILNPYTRLSVNYINTQFENGVLAVKDNLGNAVGITDGERAVTLRGQFDF